MRVLIYGLQNSGATLFSFFMGQKPASLILPDIWSMYRAPSWNIEADLCVKTTITTTFSIEDHKESFQPDLTILVIRHPEDNYISLRKKHFRNDDGSMEEKFALLDSIFDDYEKFDYVIRFEDFVMNPELIAKELCKLGWDMPPDASRLTRTPHDMEMAVWRSSPELYNLIKWGAGNSRSMPIKDIQLVRSDDQAAHEFSWRHAPRLSETYHNNPPHNTFLSQITDAKHELFDQNSIPANQSFLMDLLHSNIDTFERRIGSDGTIEDKIADCIRSAYWHSRFVALDDSTSIKQTVDKILDLINENDNPNLRIALAKYFFDMSKFEIAKNIIKNISIEKNNYYKHCYLLSEIMIKNGDIREAESLMRYHLTFEPRSVFANYRLAELLWHHGRRQQAGELLEFCIALDKDFAPAQEMLRRSVS